MVQPVVTVSASYGAGGSVVAPALAERLGWPFVDRLVTAQVSTEADEYAVRSRSGEALSVEEEAVTPPSRLLLGLARAAGVGAMMGPEAIIDTDIDLKERTETALAPLVAGGAAVVLGRASAVVLHDRPRTLHVRLDGPLEARIARGAEMEGVDRAEAERRQSRTDRARALFVRRLYHHDVLDPALYHLRLDTTVVPLDVVVDLIELLARSALDAG